MKLWDPNNLTISTVDGSPHHHVSFHGHVSVTGGSNEQLPKAAMYRAACMFVLLQMGPEALAESYKTLQDIYNWQLVPSDQTALPHVSTVKVHPEIRDVPSEAYVFDE